MVFLDALLTKFAPVKGLAYSVYSVWSPHYDYQGKFFAGGQTRTEATVPFVQSVVNEIEKLRTTPDYRRRTC